jgi:cytidylate kinase
MRPSPEAIEIDTTHSTAEQVVDRIEALVRARQPA